MARKIRRLVRRWMPPVWIDWFRGIKDGNPYHRYIWEGVYQHYGDVPIIGGGYEQENLAQATLSYTKKVLAAAWQPRFMSTEVTGEKGILPLLVSILGCTHDRVRVLDFGGGMGVDYVRVASSASGAGYLDYHIIEHESMCQLGSVLFKDDSHVHFHTALPADLARVDIVYICSALQYVEDYAALLQGLLRYQPEYFLFVNFSAGEIPTYATCQVNLPHTKVAYWFINVHEIEAFMSENGYSLIFKNMLERQYDQDNFPANYRLGQACNLLFKRQGNE